MWAKFKCSFTLKKIFACDSLLDSVNEIYKLKSQVVYLFVPFSTTMNSMFNNTICERHPTWCNVKPVGKYFAQISWSANMPFSMLNRRNIVRFFEMRRLILFTSFDELSVRSNSSFIGLCFQVREKRLWSCLALHWFPLLNTVLCFFLQLTRTRKFRISIFSSVYFPLDERQ